jgi:ankyrin repeat protein
MFAVGKGWSILHYAALSGQLAAVRFLVENLNADFRCLSWRSETPLDVAIFAGNRAIIDYLLTSHEDATPHFRTGSSPLQNIAFLPAGAIPDLVYRILSMPRAVEIDLRSGATGRTALMGAMLIQDPLYPDSRRTAAGTLLSFGANPLLATATPKTASPLFLAVQELDCDLVKEMLDSISMNGHGTSLGPRPYPRYELARSFFSLLQTPRSVKVAAGVTSYRESYVRLSSF